MRQEIQYIAISIEHLLEERTFPFSIYLKNGPDYVLYRSPDIPFRHADKTRLQDNEVRTVYVHPEERTQLVGYFEQELNTILTDKRIPMDTRADLLYEASNTVMGDLFEDPTSKPDMKRAQNLVKNTMTYLQLGKTAFHALIRVSTHDYQTYLHSVHVHVYSIAVASALEVAPNDIYKLGVGAILHDMGKTKIPNEILQMEIPLSLADWDVIRKHPGYGIELLENHPDTPREALEVVYQHHERLDGSGYPRGLTAGEISIFPRIVALSDAFDAMTSEQSYRKAISVFDALNELKFLCQSKYDESIFKVFVQLMGR